MQYLTRRRRKLQKQVQKEMDDLLHEHESLEILRDCKTLWDALHFYLPQAHLSEHERNQLRECLQILCRGRE